MQFRTKFIIDKKFQYSFFLRNLTLLFFTFFLIFITIFVWKVYEVKQGFLLKPPTASEMEAWAEENKIDITSPEYLRQYMLKAKVYTYFQLLWKPLLAILLLNVLILFIANIYYSHRIVGPIFRLKRMLERKTKGEEVNPIFFRKNDNFHDLAELINKILFPDKFK
ncbi:MAG: hypothetical protein JW871_06390 [Endomicrobiales bacterium]|nr:hypothetical protein [Endomicrobiales bacterium]